jgi:hypothetical protein
VLADDELKGMAWSLTNNGFVNPSYRSRGPSGFWTMEAALYRAWTEEALPSDLRDQVFKAFDELLPLYLKVTALHSP